MVDVLKENPKTTREITPTTQSLIPLRTTNAMAEETAMKETTKEITKKHSFIRNAGQILKDAALFTGFATAALTPYMLGVLHFTIPQYETWLVLQQGIQVPFLGAAFSYVIRKLYTRDEKIAKETNTKTNLTEKAKHVVRDAAVSFAWFTAGLTPSMFLLVHNTVPQYEAWVAANAFLVPPIGVAYSYILKHIDRWKANRASKKQPLTPSNS